MPRFDCGTISAQSRRKCSPTICTISIRSFSGSTTTSARDGMGSLMCLRLSPAIFFSLWLSKRGYADLPPQSVGDFITGCALFGVIVGGRLGYVFFYKPEMLREPLSILRVWEGGMSSHGGMLGLLLFTLYYARRHKISWTESRRQSRRNGADGIVLRTLRELHQWRALRADHECSVGDAIPEGTVRSSPGSRARSGGMRANRSVADHAGCDRRRGAQSARGRERVALNSCRRAIRRSFTKLFSRASRCSRFSGLCGRACASQTAF